MAEKEETANTRSRKTVMFKQTPEVTVISQVDKDSDIDINHEKAIHQPELLIEELDKPTMTNNYLSSGVHSSALSYASHTGKERSSPLRRDSDQAINDVIKRASAMTLGSQRSASQDTVMTQNLIKQKLTQVRYTSNIDQVYQLKKEEVNKYMHRLQAMLKKDPQKFENDYRNLKSYIDDLENEEEEKRAKKSFALEQQPQQAQLAKERKEELENLCMKYNIKVNLDQELYFEQLMQMRSQQPGFFYEFKKHRTVLTKEKEPEKPELYYKTYLRQIEKEKKEQEKKKRQEEKKRQILEQLELEQFKAGKGSNMPVVQPTNDELNINLTQNAIKREQTEPTDRNKAGSTIPISSFFIDKHGDLVQNRTVSVRQESANPRISRVNDFNDNGVDHPMSTFLLQNNNDTGMSIVTGPRTISPRGQRASDSTTRHPVGSLKEIGDVQAVYTQMKNQKKGSVDVRDLMRSQGGQRPGSKPNWTHLKQELDNILIDDRQSDGTLASTNVGNMTLARLSGQLKSGVFTSHAGVARRLNAVTSARNTVNSSAVRLGVSQTQRKDRRRNLNLNSQQELGVNAAGVMSGMIKVNAWTNQQGRPGTQGAPRLSMNASSVVFNPNQPYGTQQPARSELESGQQVLKSKAKPQSSLSRAAKSFTRANIKPQSSFVSKREHLTMNDRSIKSMQRRLGEQLASTSVYAQSQNERLRKGQAGYEERKVLQTSVMDGPPDAGLEEIGLTGAKKSRKDHVISRSQSDARYRVSTKGPVPKLRSSELSQRIQRHPLSKNELVEYLIRLQQSNHAIERETYRKLINCPKFQEILNEVQIQRTKKRDCKRIMDMCQAVQEDTAETVKKIDYVILDEKLRSSEFSTTLAIIQDLDSNKPEAFPLLFQFKKEDVNDKINMSKEVATYYKSGKNDPSKIAGLEKMQKQTAARKRQKFVR